MYVFWGHFFRKPKKLGPHTASKWWPGDPDVKDDPNDPLIRWPSDPVPCLVATYVCNVRRDFWYPFNCKFRPTNESSCEKNFLNQLRSAAVVRCDGVPGFGCLQERWRGSAGAPGWPDVDLLDSCCCYFWSLQPRTELGHESVPPLFWYTLYMWNKTTDVWKILESACMNSWSPRAQRVNFALFGAHFRKYMRGLWSENIVTSVTKTKFLNFRKWVKWALIVIFVTRHCRVDVGLYLGWSNVTESMVTIRSPFCGYNTT